MQAIKPTTNPTTTKQPTPKKEKKQMATTAPATDSPPAPSTLMDVPVASPTHEAAAADALADDAPKMTGSREQFHRFQTAACAIAVEQIRSARIDVGRVVRNAAKGARAVLAQRAEIAKLPAVSIDHIESLTNMGEALAFAVHAVDKFLPITGDTRLVIEQAQRLRTKLLAKADVLVVDGVIPAQVVRGIRQGKGPRDTASDLVALADLFQQNAAAVRARIVIDAADLETADDIGRRLLATILAPGERREQLPELVAAMDARDRLWTLFERTWEANVWRAGADLFLRDVEARVPLLMSATRRRRATDPVPAMPPAPGTGAPVPPTPVSA